MADPEEAPQKLEGVTQVADVDVLCGRGGAALRHPGNQTYRRLVNLNKGLYITCLKTEKLKISRSIVAAIREQKGRFLEKDSKTNTWYDIGDKKAVEKTSQALREGQPKLRQKIVEMGGGAMGAASLMERQYGAPAGVYPEQVGLNTAGNLESILPPATATQQEVAALAAAQIQHSMASSQTSQATQRAGNHAAAGMQPPPDALPEDIQSDMLNRLSLRDLNGEASDEFPHPQHPHRTARDLRPSLTLRGSGVAGQLGITESQLSLMSDFSAFGGSNRDGMMVNESMQNMDAASFRARGMDRPHAANNHSLQSVTSGDFNYRGSFGSGGGAAAGGPRAQLEGRQTMPAPGGMGVRGDGSMPAAFHSSLPAKPGLHNHHPHHQSMADRRSMFARMKYTRPPSAHGSGKMGTGSSHHGSIRDGASNHSLGDGMPDIHMVESQLSLISNMTDHNNSKHTPQAATSSAVAPSSSSAAPERKAGKAGDEKMEGSSAHSAGMDIGSRHSIMSGLSRISDTSIDASIFSDLSKKIGNVSTRSIAMSDMSGYDLTQHGQGSGGEFDLLQERAILDGEDEGGFNEAVERVTAADFDA